MPYVGNTYVLPAVYLAVPGTTIVAVQHNTPLVDLQDAQNFARPIVGGGTGADTAAGALTNLGAAGTSIVNQFSKTQSWSKGADIVSATSLALGTDGNYFHVTGTTTITGISTKPSGTLIVLEFDAALTLTYDATNLILPSGINITTAAGDVAIFVSEGTAMWRCVSYTKKQTGGVTYFPTTVRFAQNTTNTPGDGNNTTGAVHASTGRLYVSDGPQAGLFNVTVDGSVVLFNSGGTNRGSVSISGPVTSYNTSSDERLKQSFRTFDAGAILDAINVYHFQWKLNETWGYGVKAQEAASIFPDAITQGNGEPGESGFMPWYADYSKFVPLLLAEIKALRARVAALEAAP